MEKIIKKKIPYPGLRNIKTALSILLLIVLYQILGRSNVQIAAIAAIICMQDRVDKSMKEGATRVIATIFGGLFGITFALFGMENFSHIEKDLIITVSIIVIIYSCNLLKKPELIINGCIVFLLIVLQPEDSAIAPLIYSYNRIIDTILGIVITVLVNRFFFPPKPERVAQKRGELIQLHSNFEIIRSGNYKVFRWDGGRTTELAIFPKDSIFSDKNFKWRISKSTTELSQADFGFLTNYNQHLMVIEGGTILVHDGEHTIKLERYEQDFFSCDWKTSSIGKYKDFNLVLAKDYTGSIAAVHNNEEFDLLSSTPDDTKLFDTCIFYCMENNVKFVVKKDSKEVVWETLNKGDTIAFSHISKFEVGSLFCSFASAENSDQVVVIKTEICGGSVE